jgi:hypothetical protein
MADRAAPDIRLGDLVHFDGGHHARGNALFFERILQRQRVDHGGEHPHMVRRHPIHVLRRRRDAAKEISAADHQANLDAATRHLRDLRCQSRDTRRIDAEGPFARQHLTTQFEENASVFRHGYYSAAAVSPTLNLTNRETEIFSPSFAILVLITS